jgi:hypothetical protein
MKACLRSFAATMLSFALFPVLFSVWGVLGFAFGDVTGRWDEASWWQPYATFGGTMLFLIVGGVLLAADVFAGVWVWRRLERWCGDR